MVARVRGTGSTTNETATRARSLRIMRQTRGKQAGVWVERPGILCGRDGSTFYMRHWPLKPDICFGAPDRRSRVA